MITYDELNDVQSFWQTFGAIHRQLLQFESTAKSLDAEDDSDSPYVQDKDGNVFLKKELLAKGELTEDDIDEEDYDYEYLIEEETEYEHIMVPLSAAPPKHYAPVLNGQLPHLTVSQEEGAEESYKFKPQDLFDFYFGFLSGALNTLPVGSNLNTCGKNVRLQ